MLLSLTLIHAVVSTDYHVMPDNTNETTNMTNMAHTLQYYLLNVDKVVTSHLQLNFQPVEYYLKTDLVIKSVYNFTLRGNDSTLKCTGYASVVIVNVTNFVVENISSINCGKYIPCLWFKF